MLVTVQNLSGELKRQVESRLGQILEPSSIGDLTVSPICAHVILESVRALAAKQAEQEVLSSSTIFLTAMIFSMRLAEEGLPDIDAAERPEQARLQKWGAALRDHRETVQSLIAEFFASGPRPARNVFENIAEEPPSEIWIGPGLARTLNASEEARPLTTPDLLLRLAGDEKAGIAGRLRNREAQGLAALLEEDEAPEPDDDWDVPKGWRHARMFREAEQDELVLGVGDYAKAIATVLRAAKGEFTFALLGRWGSGKTTLVSQLEPLLVDSDTYRTAIGAPSGIRENYARRSYRVAKHNAWKYPSRPEAWVYAYKSLAEEASRGFGPIGRLMLAIRTSVHRRGLWPIAGTLMILALSALPLTAKLQLAVLALSVIGFSTMVYLGAVASSVSGKVRALFAKHLRLTQVDERLGMLALIGDDVRALLASWTLPLHGDNDDRTPRSDRPRHFVLPLIVVAIVAILWTVGLLRSNLPVPAHATKEVLSGLAPTSWAKAIGPLATAEPHLPSTGEWLVFSLWLVLAFVLLALPWLWRAGRPNRVLMVIDDLDRCSPTVMLDVIEGMKLLVDDSTVNNRLQVLMLIDESVLNHAIAVRYAAMIEDRISHLDETARKAARAAARDEVTTEQNEKLFACHLRLAPMNEADVQEVVASLAAREQRKGARDRFLDRDREKTATESEYQNVFGDDEEYVPDDSLQKMVGEGMPAGAVSRKIAEREERNLLRGKQSGKQRLEDYPQVVQARDEAASKWEDTVAELRELGMSPRDALGPAPSPFENDSEVRFTRSEVADLRRQVPPFLKALNRRPSPRAIRILLFKVQLCRLLLQTRYPNEPGERSVSKILEAFRKALDTPEPLGPERTAVTIARQVI